MTKTSPYLPADLQEIFESKKHLEALLEFAANSFCEENVLFLQEVLEMKHGRNIEAAEAIIDRYIRPESPSQVNIDSTMQSHILDNFKKQKPADIEIFDEAFKHIAEMVERDTMTKFKSLTNSFDLKKYTVNSVVIPKAATHSEVVDSNGGRVQTWYRGHLLRRKGFFGTWKPYTYMKKGLYLFEFKAGANHVKSTPLNTIHLAGSMVETARTITGKNHSFILHTRDGKSYFFQASCKEEMRDWLDELSESPQPELRRAKSIPESISSAHDPTNSRESTPTTSPSGSVYHEAAFVSEDDLARSMPILRFLESFTDAIVVSDMTGTIIGFNSASEKMFGYRADEIKGKSLKLLMPEPYRSLHDAYMFRHEKFGDEKLIGKTRNLSGMRKNDEPFELQISLGKLPVKGYFIATIRERIPDQLTEQLP